MSFNVAQLQPLRWMRAHAGYAGRSSITIETRARGRKLTSIELSSSARRLLGADLAQENAHTVNATLCGFLPIL